MAVAIATTFTKSGGGGGGGVACYCRGDLISKALTELFSHAG